MAIKDWPPVQLGIFWLVLAIFGLPTWLLLTLGVSAASHKYAGQDWYEAIPIVLAFVVVCGFVVLGVAVTWKWLDSRPEKPAERN